MRSRSEAAVIAGAASSFQLSSFPARNAKVSPIPMTTASRMPISEISFLFVSALRFQELWQLRANEYPEEDDQQSFQQHQRSGFVVFMNRGWNVIRI